MQHFTTDFDPDDENHIDINGHFNLVFDYLFLSLENPILDYLKGLLSVDWLILSLHSFGSTVLCLAGSVLAPRMYRSIAPM